LASVLCLLDAPALPLQQLLKRAGLLMAAFGKLALGFLDGLAGALLKCRQKIDHVLLGKREGTRDDGIGGAATCGERVLELVESGLLAALSKRAQRLGAAPGLGPDGGDLDDLFVQARSGGTVEDDAAEQHHARLCAWA
jgi:hypothetical protein